MKYQDLIQAMALVLVDCSVTGNYICRYTKARARIALEPFLEELPPTLTAIVHEATLMSLTEATEILEEAHAILAEEETEC